LSNGKVPTVTDISKNSSLNTDPKDLSAQSSDASSSYLTEKWMKEIGDDIYKAHEVSIWPLSK
jgi:hypothetical protein